MPLFEMDEAEFAAELQELVDATTPRLFAIVAELGEREDAYVTAWGMELDDSTVLLLAGEPPAFMLCDSPEQAHRQLSRLGPARLLRPSAPTAPRAPDAGPARRGRRAAGCRRVSVIRQISTDQCGTELRYAVVPKLSVKNRDVTMVVRHFTAVLAVLGAGLAPAAPAVAGPVAGPAARPYRTVLLGTLPGGTFSFATAMNAFGDVVGVSSVASGDSHAFLWHAGRMTDLGTLGGNTTYPTDINARGEVVGFGRTADDITDHAFLWSAGRLRDLGALGLNGSQALGINDGGTIVGQVFTGNGSRAFRWTAGRLTLLPTDRARAQDINTTGTIVGTGPGSGTGNDFRRLLRWDGTTPTVLNEVPGFTSSFGGPRINSSGDVVATYYISHTPTPFVWLDGARREPAVLDRNTGCQANGINDRRQIVGSCVINSMRIAYLADGDTAAVDLSTRGIPVDTSVAAVNNRGQIAGTVQLDLGQQAALFTP